MELGHDDKRYYRDMNDGYGRGGGGGGGGGGGMGYPPNNMPQYNNNRSPRGNAIIGNSFLDQNNQRIGGSSYDNYGNTNVNRMSPNRMGNGGQYDNYGNPNVNKMSPQRHLDSRMTPPINQRMSPTGSLNSADFPFYGAPDIGQLDDDMPLPPKSNGYGYHNSKGGMDLGLDQNYDGLRIGGNGRHNQQQQDGAFWGGNGNPNLSSLQNERMKNEMRAQNMQGMLMKNPNMGGYQNQRMNQIGMQNDWDNLTTSSRMSGGSGHSSHDMSGNIGFNVDDYQGNMSHGMMHHNNGMNSKLKPYGQQMRSHNIEMPINSASQRGGYNSGTGGSNAQGRALNKMLLEILRDRIIEPNRLAMAIDSNIDQMDCVNLATLLFHTGKKRLLLAPNFIKRIAARFNQLKEELRAREASNALYGLKCMSSECAEVRQLIFALASKVEASSTELVAQAVGNALYGCQMMTSDHEEVRYLLQVLAIKVSQCSELLEAQNVGNALYGLRGMSSDCKEVRTLLSALTPKVATAREELNGQALGNSLYGMQGMSSREPEVRAMLTVLASKATLTWEDLKAQEVGNALYGLKRMNSDVPEVRILIEALVPKVAASPEILDAQAIGNSFYGMQCMRSDNSAVLSLLSTMAEKVTLSHAELDGQAMGNSLYGLQGMSSDHPEVRAVVSAITTKIQSSCLEMNAQELGNALYGLQNMTSAWPEVRRLMAALALKVSTSKHELTSQEIGNALFGLQGMRSDVWETRVLVRQMGIKIQQSHSLIDPQGVANSLFGMQRMSSDCEEVRTLVQALAVKIEQSWKLLSANHLSNAIFGLQGLSSNEMEVRTLINSLIPKVIACRDELSARHVCNIVYGFKSMSSSHEEVRAILATLQDKINVCTELFTFKGISAAMFGLQGMDSSFPEVRALITLLVDKLSVVDADDLDYLSLANSFVGLQRLDTSSSEVCSLLRILSPLFISLANDGISLNEMNGKTGTRVMDFSAHVVGNILYGLQNCSCTEESVREVISSLINRSKQLIVDFESNPQFASLDGSIDFQDILYLHQIYCLILVTLPDLQVDEELRSDLSSTSLQLQEIVESRINEVKPAKLSNEETLLSEVVTDVLANEPFTVSTSFVNGFECGVLIKLKEGVRLTLSNGEAWNPVVNIEVQGTTDSFPSKELWGRIRAKYLSEQHGVSVKFIHHTVFDGQARPNIRDKIYCADGLLAALYPPTPYDTQHISTLLFGMGMVGPGGIMSTVQLDKSKQQQLDLQKDRMGSSFFTLPMMEDNAQGVQDYNGEYITSRSGQTLLSSKGVRAMKGLKMGWLGDQPVVKASAQGIRPITVLNPNTPAFVNSVPSTLNAKASSYPNPNAASWPPAPANRNGNGIGSEGDSYDPRQGVSQYQDYSETEIPLSMASYDQGQYYKPNSQYGDGSVGYVETGETVGDTNEIALLEAQLEIVRIEARLLALKQAKKSPINK